MLIFLLFSSNHCVALRVGPYGFAWRCFTLLGLELKFFGVEGGFPHSPGSTGSGHFLYNIVSRLGSCCKFSPLVSLLDNYMGVRSTRVRTIVCTPWISPLQGSNPRPTRGPMAKHHCHSSRVHRYCCPHISMYGPQARLLTVCQHH